MSLSRSIPNLFSYVVKYSLLLLKSVWIGSVLAICNLKKKTKLFYKILR